MAAANTPDDLKALATYVCDGVDDQDEIQEALSSVTHPGGTWGGQIGRVVLLAGTFNTSATLVPLLRTLEGVGLSSTIVYSGDAWAIDATGSFTRVAHLFIQANASTGGAVSLTGGDSVLDHCYLLQNHSSATIATVVLGGTGSRMTGCHIVGSALGVEIFSGSDFVDVGDNYVEANTGVLLNGCSFCTVHDNRIRGASQATGHGILLQGSADDNTITGNVLTAYGVDGIRLVNVGAATPDRNSVQGNMCRETLSGGDGYGINVLSGVNNFITNNDLLTSGALGSFNDAGTGTITTAGNRV